MKLIMSEAIIAVPPKNRSPLSSKLLIAALVVSINMSLSWESSVLRALISILISSKARS